MGTTFFGNKGVAVSNQFRILGALTLLVVAGCGYSRPLIGPQGTIKQQQYDASVHDPYADEDLGPEVVGSRPRDFQKPFAEPVRSRWYDSSWWNR